MDVERIYCAEQIVVPPELPEIIKVFTKEVIRANPADLDEFGAQYFGALAGVEGYEDQGKDADESDDE